MRFVHELTVPKNTLATASHIRTVYLVKGRLTNISIGFPPGCAAMVKIIVKDGLLQIAPSTPEKTFYWDAHIERVPMDYELTDLKHQLTIEGWSPGTRYPHTITLGFDVKPSGGDSERALLEMLFRLPGVE